MSEDQVEAIAPLSSKTPIPSAGNVYWIWYSYPYLFPYAGDAWLKRMEAHFLPSFVFERLDGYCKITDASKMYCSHEEAVQALHRVRTSLEPLTVGPVPGYDCLPGMGPHRKDDPATIAEMRKGFSS